MWRSRKKQKLTADRLWARWFRPQVPEGFASLDAFEAAITEEEQQRLPKTLAKLANDGVERIYQVRGHDLEPNRDGLVFLDELLDAEMRWKLTQDQDPHFPRNLFRLVSTEFGCVVGEIYARADKGVWEPQRAPNHWRSLIRLESGVDFDPFRAVVRKMSDERKAEALVNHYDAQTGSR